LWTRYEGGLARAAKLDKKTSERFQITFINVLGEAVVIISKYKNYLSQKVNKLKIVVSLQFSNDN